MHGASKQGDGRIDSDAEHLVILQVAGVTRGRRRERIHRALTGVEADRIDGAIASLAAVGLVAVRGRSVHQSSALERIDLLGYITV
jgi:hypothetical protein